jgi:hypothetical protein
LESVLKDKDQNLALKENALFTSEQRGNRLAGSLERLTATSCAEISSLQSMKAGLERELSKTTDEACVLRQQLLELTDECVARDIRNRKHQNKQEFLEIVKRVWTDRTKNTRLDDCDGENDDDSADH